MPRLSPIPIETARPTRAVASEAHTRLLAELAKAEERADAKQTCAYNGTHEAFAAMNVVAGDFPLAGLKDWLATLRPHSANAVWMTPFRGIVAEDVTAPIDLLYLDTEGRVIEAVEFFPSFRASPSMPTAASVLALPSHTIFSSHTQRGDRVLVCTLDEMHWRLDQATQQGVRPDDVLSGGAGSGPANSGPGSTLSIAPQFTTGTPHAQVHEFPGRSNGPMLVREEPRPNAQMPAAAPPTLAPIPDPPAPMTAAPVPTAPPAAPGGKPAPAQRGWLSRLLTPEPVDPRRATHRQAVNGLAAHFFTGGGPQAHQVRDVSPTGLYVITTERWYPGTVIRMTLTRQGDNEHPTERSITVHAQTMRWGNDGVGLQFLIEPRKSKSAPAGFADREDLEAFLKRLN